MLFKQGSIVLVDFSYSDLKEIKFRPALVISNSEYNESSIDVVVLRERQEVETGSGSRRY